ncbi:MAG TPA: hypothetical protein VOA41_17230 [Candidatus Dormibacteraeota bacterium]|nr:hypothetical protein [Candidatus Dormibacteraeota bacterium]
MRTRGPIAVLLAVIAGAGIFMYSYARRHAGGIAPAADPPELVELAPVDSTVLLYADVAALRSSAFVMRLLAMVPPVTKDRDYAEFVRATGFDYERDLDRLVLAMLDEGKNAVTTAIVDGRFDQKKIAAYALRTGKLEKQTSGDVYLIPAKSPGKTVVIRFLNSNRILLTDSRKLQPASEPIPKPSANTSERGNRSAPEMQERIARVSGAPLFAVAKLDSAMQKKEFSFHDIRSEQLENLARSVRWLSLAARPEGDRVDLALDGECDTAENAQQLAGTLEGLRIMGRMALADPKTGRQMDPATLRVLGTLLRSAEVSRDDKGQVHRVRLTFVISQKAVAAGTASK